MRIRNNNGIETKKKRERVNMLKLECRYGNHEWGNSASPYFEKCQRSFCGAVRKITKKDDNSRGQVTMDTGSPIHP